MDNIFDFKELQDWGFTNKDFIDFIDNLLYLLTLDKDNCIQDREMDFFILFIRIIVSSAFKNMVVRENTDPVEK